MGNHDAGRAFAAAADVFWIVVGEDEPSKETTLKALEAVGEYFRGSDAEFDDALYTHMTPLGRMVAIAFSATSDEMADDAEDAWYEGPVTRFREHLGLA